VAAGGSLLCQMLLHQLLRKRFHCCLHASQLQTPISRPCECLLSLQGSLCLNCCQPALLRLSYPSLILI
jgi:hypothetical protein